MRLSIGRKFQIYVTAVLVVGALLVFAVVRSVIKSEYTQHFSEELATAEGVLVNYFESRYALLKSGIDILLSDPRFLAAIAEADPATVQNEVFSFRLLVQAELFAIADAAGNIIAVSHDNQLGEIASLPILSGKYDHDIQSGYLVLNGVPLQILTAPVSFGASDRRGQLVVGYSLDQSLLQRLQKLTASQMFLVVQDSIRFSGDQASVAGVREFLREDSGDKRIVHTRTIDDEAHLILRHNLSDSPNIAAVLVRSLDAQLAPAIANISLALILLTIGASLLSLFLIYRFTQRRLTAAVDRLVSAAAKISNGELDQAIVPVNDDELGYLSTCFDTMRQTLASNREVIARAQDERIRQERLATIGQLAAGIIHDFKSPMTAIALSVEAIEHGLGGEGKRAGYCQSVKAQVQRMVHMTQDLLDYAHGNRALTMQATAIGELIQQQVESHQDRFKKHGIELTVDPSEELTLSLDAPKFRRVLDNLLANALEALAPGNSVRVWVESGAAQVHVHVKDDGPGIPPEIRPRIFQPFVTHGKSTGTGLGLAISRKTINDHGGELAVVNENDRGAHFVIALPAQLICDRTERFSTVGEVAAL